MGFALIIALCSISAQEWATARFTNQKDTYVLAADLPANRLDITSPQGSPLVTVTALAGLTFTDGRQLLSSQMLAQAMPPDETSVKFTSPEADIVVSLDPQPDRLVFHAEILCKQGIIMHIAIPHTFQLTGQPRRRFLWPSILGCELSEVFLASGKRLQEDYPPAFCDFAAAEIAGTPVFFYRCEPEDRPRASTLVVRGGNPPVFRHWYKAYIREGERWTMPAFALQVGGAVRETLLRYKRECRLGKPLEEKMTGEFRTRWAGMTQATLPPPFTDAPQIIRALPMPAILEPQGWMFGGFDRKYPDFLPPNPNQGGDAAFRELIRAAHQHGHLVRPYVNFTWWCTGWEGLGSQPAPSYDKHGDIALSRRLNGELIYENYSGNYGYCVCPAHPVAVQRRLEVRDALLDDYGVDFLYEDQLGARTWPLDLNPALTNPADYGWALMRIGEEDAARCPIETEFGHDRVLSFASALNYWTVAPLAPVHTFPNRPAPEWSDAEQRSFPFALFLSGGDAIINIPRCNEPDRLAWAMLLGGRVTLGTVRESVEVGPHREQVTFLQLLAKALADRAVGDQLKQFEYLAPRVARSTFERHEVIANFTDQPWSVEDGTKIAPDGFDLRANDGFRAGRYIAARGEPVFVMLDPGERAATSLAPGPFAVQVGAYNIRAEEPVRDRTITGRQVAVLDLGLGGVSNGGLDGDALREAFAVLGPARITSCAELTADLDRFRVLVNAHSEYLLTERLSEWPHALERLRAWCESGGILVEIGGWPCWIVAAPGAEPGQWTRKRIGPTGFHALCAEQCRIVAPPAKPSALRLTERGQAILSQETWRALSESGGLITRPPLAPQNAIVLCEGDEGAYLLVHPTGYGAVVRVGGVPTASAAKALAEIVEALLDRRLDTGAPVWRAPVCRHVPLR